MNHASSFARIGILTLVFAHAAQAEVITWTGASGTGSWHTMGNWDLNRTPTTGDDVVIPSIGVAATVIYSGTTTDINSLASDKPFVISGGILNLAATSSISNVFTLSGGTRAGAGLLTVSGLFTWSGGTLDGGGRTTCNGGMSWITSGRTLRNHILENAGNATWTAGNVSSGQGGVFNNLAAGVFDVQGDLTWFFNLGGTACTINNAGTFKKTTGATTAALSVNLANSGSVQGNSGTLSFAAGDAASNSTGSFSATNGNAVGFSQGPAGVQNLAGTVNGAGTFFVSGSGIVNVNAGAAFSPGVLFVSGGTLNMNTDGTCGAVTLAGGTRSGLSVLTASGLFTWSGGTLDGGGRTTCNGGMSWITSGRTLRNHILENAGNATWTAGNVSSGQGGVFNNLAAGVFDIQGDLTWFFNLGGTSATVNNAGTFKKTTGATTAGLNVNLVNSGSVQGNSGTLSFGGDAANNSSGSFSATNGNFVGFGQGATNIQNLTGTINGAGTFFVAVGTVNVNAGATFSPGGLSVSGGTLNMNTDGACGAFALSGGARAGLSVLTVSGLFTWSGGTLDGGGRTTCNGGMSWIGSGKSLRNHILENAGNATWTAGDISSGQGGVFNNLATGVFDIQGNFTWFFNLGGASSTVNNAGTFKKTAGATTAALTFNLVNSGSVQGNSGILSFGGDSSNNSTGALSATNGNAVGFSQGPAGVQNLTGTVNGAGTFFVSGSGMVNVNTGAAFSPGVLSVSGGTLSMNTDGACGGFTLAGGTRTGLNVLTVSGLFTWSAGTLDGGGRTACNGGMSWIGSGKSLRSHILENAGNATWTVGDVSSGQGGIFNNLAAGVFDIQGNATWFFNLGGTSATVNNAGTFKKTAGAGTATITVGGFNNSQSVQCDSGTLAVNGAYLQTAGSTVLGGANLSSTSTINIQAGIIGGVGTIIGNVQNAGTAQPGISPGILNVSGNYTQSAAGVLEIEIGGLTVGTQYDRFAVTGVATLDGILRLRLINAFIPALGNTFVIMSFGSHIGTFSNYDADCFATGQFDVIYSTANITLAIKAPIQGDLNCDCVLNTVDLSYMLTALLDPGAFTGCNILRADFDGDAIVDGRDIQGFASLIVP